MTSIPNQTIIPQPLGHGRYRVESRSGGKGHDVDVPAGRCTCPAPNGTCWAFKLCADVEQRRADTVISLQEQLAAMRRERAKAIDLAQCCTCHARPAAAGYAECGFCRMDAVFGVKAVAS